MGRFSIREDIDQDYVARLAQSLLDDGQWHPIIVRPIEGGRYQLISGHYRLQAAKRAGLKEIEADVRDLSTEEADLLSLKTNMLRLEMTPREQGLILSKIMERYSWNQSEIARKLSVEPKWVGRRLRIALQLHDEVAKAIDDGRVNFSVASIIGGVSRELQPSLLKIILDRGITSITDAGDLRRQLLNDTIYTIGFEGLEIEEFIDILKRNNISQLIDVRHSSESIYEPDFNGKVLERELSRNNIKYEHRHEYGVPDIILTPYKEEELNYHCLKQWYKWHIKIQANIDELIGFIKKSGNVVLMSDERKKYPSHSDILADFILEYEIKDELMKFKKKINL